jgi:hypothetical protein
MLKLMLLNMIWFKGESRLDLEDLRKIKWGLKLIFFLNKFFFYWFKLTYLTCDMRFELNLINFV